MSLIDTTLKSKDITYNDILREQKINVISKFETLKKDNPKRKNNDIAKELNYSMSTLNRYKSDIGFVSTRKAVNHTSAQKQAIYLKSLKTKMAKEELKSEREDICAMYKKGEIKIDEFNSEIDKLQEKLSTVPTGLKPNTTTKATREKMRGGHYNGHVNTELASNRLNTMMKEAATGDYSEVERITGVQ